VVPRAAMSLVGLASVTGTLLTAINAPARGAQ